MKRIISSIKGIKGKLFPNPYREAALRIVAQYFTDAIWTVKEERERSDSVFRRLEENWLSYGFNTSREVIVYSVYAVLNIPRGELFLMGDPQQVLERYSLARFRQRGKSS